MTGNFLLHRRHILLAWNIRIKTNRMPGRLEEKVAIITGGGGGFGKVSCSTHETAFSSNIGARLRD
jgi:FlaA1/EpsC-like NDP-sugar epimerase